jgi:hypothetical protein
MSAAASKRRRRQYANGFAHLPKQRRPGYKITSIEKAKRRLEQVVEKQKAMQRRKKV